MRLLESLGYKEHRTGKTGGSRRRFVHRDAPTISLHKPDPGNIVKMYAVDEVMRVLTEEGHDTKGLKRAFKEAVDDYIALCTETGREPDTPLKGSFNVRTGPTFTARR